MVTLSDVNKSLELGAAKLGITVEEMIRQIDLSIIDAMSNPDPAMQARWKMVPRKGERPTAAELIAYLGNLPRSPLTLFHK